VQVSDDFDELRKNLARAIVNARKVLLPLPFLILYYRKSVCNIVSMKLVFEERSLLILFNVFNPLST
jgi:hypothetical protein